MKFGLKIAIVLAPFFAIVLAVFELLLTNQLVGSGKTIRSVDIAIDEVRQQNKILESQVASASSLITVERKAKEMGFIEPRSAQYMTLIPDQLPVAFNASLK